MNSYFYSLDETKKYLESLNIDPDSNALWDVLHLARWHKGIDWVMWIDANKKLVEQIIQHKYFAFVPEDLKKQIRDSIYEIKNLDR